MSRLLLAAATLAAAIATTPVGAAGCTTADLRGCTTQVCGRPYEDGCGPVDRCYHWSDYPTCLYQPVEPFCVYPYDGGWCVPWHPEVAS